VSAARLVGDGVENPANARALLDAAALFGVPCAFRDSRGLAERWSPGRGGGPLPVVRTGELLAPLVAVDNGPGVASVYTATLPAGRSQIVVGNERRGIRPDLLRAAASRVQIPMPGRGVNTLNVASAAAVALYYLLDAAGRRAVRSARPDAHRPAVLLLGPGDHVEAGSALRSAAAFGWTTVGIDDRDKVWFGTPRPVRAEARAAARSHRNPLRVVPMAPVAGFDRVIVAGTRVDGPPLHRTPLVGRANTLLVVPDEDAIGPDEDWRRLGGVVEFARVGFPGTATASRYRLVASVVLAEAARQLGRRTATGPAGPRPPYRSTLPVVPAADVDLVTPAELAAY
jgi:tRNA G18 (ribose-2'-O)-methylase SpoU